MRKPEAATADRDDRRGQGCGFPGKQLRDQGTQQRLSPSRSDVEGKGRSGLFIVFLFLFLLFVVPLFVVFVVPVFVFLVFVPLLLFVFEVFVV